jgi:hypothetical protein
MPCLFSTTTTNAPPYTSKKAKSPASITNTTSPPRPFKPSKLGHKGVSCCATPIPPKHALLPFTTTPISGYSISIPPAAMLSSNPSKKPATASAFCSIPPKHPPLLQHNPPAIVLLGEGLAQKDEALLAQLEESRPQRPSLVSPRPPRNPTPRTPRSRKKLVLLPLSAR